MSAISAASPIAFPFWRRHCLTGRLCLLLLPFQRGRLDVMRTSAWTDFQSSGKMEASCCTSLPSSSKRLRFFALCSCLSCHILILSITPPQVSPTYISLPEHAASSPIDSHLYTIFQEHCHYSYLSSGSWTSLTGGGSTCHPPGSGPPSK